MFRPERYAVLNRLESVSTQKSPKRRPAEGLGDRLKEAFGTNSVQQIADRLKMSYQGVDHLIKGRRKFNDSLLLEISSLTGCSIHWLLTGEGSKNPTTVSLTELSITSPLTKREREMVESLLAVLKKSLKG